MPPLDLTSELPAPRDDEPASLRRDIADELADHLECSFLREQVKTADESLAQRRVLEKFGNPASIARKLWWDAMWEKIVMQRISTFVSSAAAIAALGVCLLLWRSLEASRAFQAQQLAKFESSLSALVEELRKRPEAKTESNWADVTVKLVREDGTPARGKVYLVGADAPVSIDSLRAPINRMASLSFSAGADGIARISGVPYDKYQLIASLEDPDSYAFQQVFVSPGNVSFEFSCPNTVPEITVRAEMQPPEDLKALPFCYTLEISANDATEVNGLIWHMHNRGMVHFVFAADGRYLGQFEKEKYTAGPLIRAWADLQLAPASTFRLLHDTKFFPIQLSVHARLPAGTRHPREGGDAIPADAYFEVKAARNSGRFNSIAPHQLTPGENLIRIDSLDSFWNRVRTLHNASQVEIGDVLVQRQPDGSFQPSGRGGLGRGGGGDFGGGGRIGPGGGNTGGGRGGGGRGGGGRGGLLNELQRADTLELIALTAEQQQQIEALREQAQNGQSTGMEAQLTRVQNAQTEDERAAAIEAAQQWQLAETAKVNEDVRQILTPDQRAKLDSVRLQRSGPLLLLSDAALQVELKLTEEQVQAIQTLSRERQERMSTSSREKHQPLTEEYTDKMLAVLTPDQRAEWDAKVGPPIEINSVPNTNPAAARGELGGL